MPIKKTKQRIQGQLKYCIGLFAIPLAVLAFQHPQNSEERAPASTEKKQKMTHNTSKPMLSFHSNLNAEDILLRGEELEFSLRLTGKSQVDASDIQVQWIVPDSYQLVSGNIESSLGEKKAGEIFEDIIRVKAKPNMADIIRVQVSNTLDSGAKLGSIANIRPYEVMAKYNEQSDMPNTLLKSSLENETKDLPSKEEDKPDEIKPKMFY